MEELEQARKQAAEINQPSAAVSATVAKAKLAGLVVDRKEVGKPGEFDGMNVDELREHVGRAIEKLALALRTLERKEKAERLENQFIDFVREAWPAIDPAP